MKKIIYYLSIILIMFVGCTDDVEFSSNTEALGTFKVISPVSSASFALNSGTPDNTIQFNWTEATPGVAKKPTYTLSLFLVDNESAFKSFPSDNEGNSTTLALPFSNIDQAIADAGFSIGEEASIQWQVTATNGDVEVKTGKTNIAITRFSDDGIMAFNLLTPDNNIVITADVFGTPNEEVAFTWEEAVTTSGTGVIEYTVLFDEFDGDFSEPLLTFPILSGLSFTMTHQEIGDNFASNANVKWTVIAKITDSTTELKADAKYVNWDVFVINELYLVGSHNGWNNATATAFTNDGNGAFSLQIDLLAGAEFKFLPTQTNFEGDWGEDPANPGKLIQEGENNASVANAGTYLITVDFATLSFTVTEFVFPDVLYMVGDHNMWNPATAPSMVSNLDGTYIGHLSHTALQTELKFIDAPNWDNGIYADSGDGTSGILVSPGNNITLGGPQDYEIKVDLITNTWEANTWAIIGDGTPNSWNEPDTDLRYDFDRNVWTTTVDLTDGFLKFRANNDWALNYGDNTEADGILDFNSPDNIAVSAGGWQIDLDLANNTYAIGKWAIMGDSTPNSWGEPDTDMSYDSVNAVWTLTTDLTAGLLKFRFNDSWDFNLGDNTPTDGVLETNGENIVISADGNYTITLDLNNNVYSIVIN